MPVLTLQKAHALVHVSPIIIKVAWFFCQHSEIFGQLASSQTVTILDLDKISFVFRNFLELETLTLNQLGFFKEVFSLLLTFSG